MTQHIAQHFRYPVSRFTFVMLGAWGVTGAQLLIGSRRRSKSSQAPTTARQLVGITVECKMSKRVMSSTMHGQYFHSFATTSGFANLVPV